MITYAIIGGVLVVGGLIAGRYFGKPTKPEPKKDK